MRVFLLDRDGVINRFRKGEYISCFDDFVLFPKVLDALRLIKEKGVLIGVVTNQAGINKGLIPREEYRKINDYLLSIGVDKVFTCPHAEKEKCWCRKPRPGLLLRALRYFNVGVNDVVFIGDEKKDMLAARKIGCRFILRKQAGLLKIAENELVWKK